MPAGRPPLEPMPNWPALMTTDLAARYLSVDEHSLRMVALSHGVGPVDLKVDLERWRRADLDRLVRSLPMRSPSPPRRDPPTTCISDADLDRIAARVQGARPSAERRAYSVKDVAAASGLSRATLYRLIKEGQLAPVRVGGRTLIPADQLDSLLRGETKG